jgi:hypothetical protein
MLLALLIVSPSVGVRRDPVIMPRPTGVATVCGDALQEHRGILDVCIRRQSDLTPGH